MLHSLHRHLHLFVVFMYHSCFFFPGWNYVSVSIKDIVRAVENAQWLLMLPEQQCLVLGRTGFGIFCRIWRSQHPPHHLEWSSQLTNIFQMGWNHQPDNRFCLLSSTVWTRRAHTCFEHCLRRIDGCFRPEILYARDQHRNKKTKTLYYIHILYMYIPGKCQKFNCSCCACPMTYFWVAQAPSH